MSVLVLLIIVGILVASGFLVAFIWAVKTGQYDDTYTPSIRILFDDNSDIQADNELNKEPEVKPGEK